MNILKNSLFGLSFLFFPFLANAQVGSPAPNFTVTDTQGQTHTLYDYLEAGKTVVLDFFFTTCGPCQFYSPQVNLAYEKYGCNNADVIFMSIDWDDTDAQVQIYDEEYQINYPSISGIDGGGNEVVIAYNVNGFPTFYVIDSSKIIIAQISPPTLQVFDFNFELLGIAPTDCSTTSIWEKDSSEQLGLFPNPTTEDILNVLLPDGEKGLFLYNIFDSTGKIVQHGQVDGSAPTVQLDVSAFSPGLYSLKLPSVNKVTYSGFFVKH